ncbi:MAG: M28 family peptidase [Candidatus Binatia bacterium]
MVRIDPRELEKTLERIVTERNPFSSRRHLSEVENYIEKEFSRYGLSVQSDTFTYWGTSYRNVIGRAGSVRRSPLIIVGAHFDSVEGTPGADDNASGVAVLLEAARILAKSRLRSQVLFCAFNLEELNMVGSNHFAKRLKSEGIQIDAMISLEMVGYTDSRPGSQKYPVGLRWFYPNRADFIGIIGNWRSSSLLRKFSRLMNRVRGLPVETLTVLGNGFLIPQVRLSDHSPFWDLGYPALLVTDTSFFRNPHYHSYSDTLETLDLEFMAKVCEGVILAIQQLANSHY